MGFFFLLLGGGGVFANWRRNWKLLSLIFLIGVILTVALMVTAMSAIMMASGSMDPVSEFVDLAWHDETVNFRKERETESLREELLQFRMEKEEAGRRTMLALLRSQASLVLKETFALWRGLRDDLRR